MLFAERNAGPLATRLIVITLGVVRQRRRRMRRTAARA